MAGGQPKMIKARCLWGGPPGLRPTPSSALPTIPETVQPTASSTEWLARTSLRLKRVTVETPAGKSG
jgi:hypothetical protein